MTDNNDRLASVLSASAGYTIEQGRPAATAPYACSVLAGRFVEDVGDWDMAVVSTPLVKPFTHWWPLPSSEPVPATNQAKEADITALQERIADLESELEEALYQPWPKWAEDMKKQIRDVSGYDGYDDATDGVNLPDELSELINELTEQADKNVAEALAARKLDELESSVEHYRNGMNEWIAKAQALAATQPATSQEGEGTLANPGTFGKPTFGLDATPTPPAGADEVLRMAVAKLLPIGNDSLPGDRVIPIYVRMDELRALHALSSAQVQA
jgi:hypothetical protein